MYWRPITVMFNDFPFGGSFWSAVAYSVPVSLSPIRLAPPALEFGGFWIAPRRVNVRIARPTRTTAAATVQPTSSRVLPWICAALAPLRARNLISA